MKDFRYLEGAATLRFEASECTGCSLCVQVCPHGVFAMERTQHGKRAVLEDAGACIECGACATNCAGGAITVTPGVGCAAYIIAKWFGKKGSACC